MFLLFSGSAFSQLKPLDATLSNYQYPFEVYFKEFKSQNQSLKMAFMDVKPKQFKREKPLCFFMGKTSTAHIGKKRQKI